MLDEHISKKLSGREPERVDINLFDKHCNTIVSLLVSLLIEWA